MEWIRKKEQSDFSCTVEQSMLKEENGQTGEDDFRSCTAANKNGNRTMKRKETTKNVRCSTKKKAFFYQCMLEWKERTGKNNPEKKESIELKEIIRPNLNICVRKRLACDDGLERGEAAVKLRSKNPDTIDEKHTALVDV